MEQIKFKGYNITLQFLRTDRSVRVNIDTSLDEYNNIKDIPLLTEGMFEIQITKEEK